MYMMFIYIDNKPYNTMGIRENDLVTLYQKAADITRDIFLVERIVV